MARIERRWQNSTLVVGALHIQSATDMDYETLTTADATPIAAMTYTPADGKLVMVVAHVTARYADGSKGAGYIRAATFRRAGATTTQIGSTTSVATHEDTGSMDCDIAASAANIVVNVTGVAATSIAWSSVAWIYVCP